jgi:hypothetical protein
LPDGGNCFEYWRQRPVSLSAAMRFRLRIDSGSSRSLRRQADSQGLKQARPRMPGKGSFSRTTATASPYMPRPTSCT